MTGEELILLWKIFSIYFVIGMFTFGGGFAVISMIQSQVVTAQGWIDSATFTDIVAISQMTPGPVGVNAATYTGYQAMFDLTGSHALGVLASFTATFATVLPSFIIVLALVKFYTRFRKNSIFEGVMAGLRPAVVGLIGAAAIILMFDIVPPTFAEGFSIKLIRESFFDWSSWVLFAAALFAGLKWKADPLLMIVIAGAFGILIY